MFNIMGSRLETMVEKTHKSDCVGHSQARPHSHYKLALAITEQTHPNLLEPGPDVLIRLDLDTLTDKVLSHVGRE